MKIYFLAAFLFSFLIVTLSLSKGFAQNFAPVGAKWYYTHYDFVIPPNVFTSYVSVESVADTVIVGLNCSKLKVITNNFSSQGIEYWFMRGDSDKVYYYKADSGRFLVLHDFTKQVGDSFNIEGFYSATYGGSLMAYVISSGTTLINGHVLRYYSATTNDPVAQSDFGGIELIGSTKWMFPFGDNYPTQQLRCYSDSSIGLYETGAAPYCDWTTSVSEINSESSSIEISPNPSSGIFHLTFNPNIQIQAIEIFNVLGEKVFQSNNILSTEINLSSQPEGIYFLQLKTQNGVERKILVVKK